VGKLTFLQKEEQLTAESTEGNSVSEKGFFGKIVREVLFFSACSVPSAARDAFSSRFPGGWGMANDS
jgi:hypothetical protein